MGLHNFDAEMPEDFGNRVRLFPLPNLVLFPNVVQALHIFEPRYCEMLEASLESDGLIAMALLKPGWEVQYAKRPPIADVVCIGKVVSHAPTEDNRHNILLAGLKRARIIEEEPMLHSYRMAEVQLMEDQYQAGASMDRESLRKKLSELLLQGLSQSQIQGATANLLSQNLPLGVLVDIIAYSLRLPMMVKQQMLEESNVDARCEILLGNLPESGSPKKTDSNYPIVEGMRKRSENSKSDQDNPNSGKSESEFPPPFSNN